MEDKFTSGEVAALLEELRGDFRGVAEVVIPLREDMAEVKERLTAVEGRLVRVEDGLRVGFSSLDKRVSALEAKVG